MTATQRPWKVERAAPDGQAGWWVVGPEQENGSIVLVAACETKEDADFIARACNMHYDLLATCRTAAASLAICQIPRLDDSVASNEEITRNTLDSLRAVIARAEG